jgi:hypothetical protein
MTTIHPKLTEPPPRRALQEKLTKTGNWQIDLTAEYRYSWTDPREPRKLIMVPTRRGTFAEFIEFEARWRDTKELITKMTLDRQVIVLFNSVSLYELLVFDLRTFLKLDPWEKVTINGA